MAEAFEASLNQLAQSWQQTILDSADFIIISTDINGVIQTLNTGAIEKLGYIAEEIIGIATPALFHDPKEVAQGYFILKTSISMSKDCSQRRFA
ncbi:PAS domain S-box protein [Acaryochloris sp. IP29b_bin.137]|uniref:PAS domain S-box protein n=1 Tax=Acaryochloris sp. IP29b_bin.137 TaxID=2969217 RepID=UPI002638AE6C|nr:PAS domain S-box protein [Acaryochloris sp. IP29b_bin.137]